MSKYYEDEEDLIARVFLEHAKPIMDSLQIGDYVTVSSYQDDEIQVEYIDLCDILSQKRQDILNYIHIKYGKILQHLSKDEIIAAHLEKTLEDEISE